MATDVPYIPLVTMAIYNHWRQWSQSENYNAGSGTFGMVTVVTLAKIATLMPLSPCHKWIDWFHCRNWHNWCHWNSKWSIHWPLWVVILKRVSPSSGSIGSIIMDALVTLSGDFKKSIAIEWIHWFNYNGCSGRQWRLGPPLAPLTSSPLAPMEHPFVAMSGSIGTNGANCPTH